VQLVDHEADDALGVLGHHADAIALPQAADEFFLEPGELEAGSLDVEHLLHIAADHPADVYAELWLVLVLDGHGGLLPCRPVSVALAAASDSLGGRARYQMPKNLPSRAN
jgi:hypothetical protein